MPVASPIEQKYPMEKIGTKEGGAGKDVTNPNSVGKATTCTSDRT